MSHVHDILKTKGNSTYSVGPQNTILNTLKLMAEKNIGAVLIIEGEKIIGIFSERDFARKVLQTPKRLEDIPIKDMMTSGIVSVSPSQTTDECMAIMTAKHIRHLPVLENEKLVGLISIGDVVKRIIEDHKFSINQLERYVTGEA